MNDDVYKKLASALDLLPGGFPETKSGVELQILRKIFPLEEAQVASNMTGTREEIDVIAARAGLSIEETQKRLEAMLNKGLVWGFKKEGT